jgi:hypothetical protein
LIGAGLGHDGADYGLQIVYGHHEHPARIARDCVQVILVGVISDTHGVQDHTHVFQGIGWHAGLRFTSVMPSISEQDGHLGHARRWRDVTTTVGEDGD